ncbi:hypothetical protein [Actinomadura latina]|uniref:Uncharacterized protein n=1 Tax=Actinomadura latina TaxID=163603 RepID=A0A846Z822_9ACTN|nr:hypothetical protein [Actinomadura latina]NKZ06745.1 hypothetical protein [Actinomadura latina]
MRSRIFGPLLAAAAVTAMAVPASAEEAPPPAPQTQEEAPPPVPQSYTVDDCSEALSFLSSLLKGLRTDQDLTKAVCSMKEQQKPEDAKTGPVESTYTDPEGRTVKDNRLLGLPVEWPKSLTVQVPTFNQGMYRYSSGR